MPSLSELPDLSVKELTKVLKHLGFVISSRGGKGSHIKVTNVQTQKSFTIPSKMNKNVLYYLVKEIEKSTSIVWEDIKRRL